MDLDHIPFKATRYPGISIHFFHSDRTRGRATVLIRMEPGCGYPRHRHRGVEELFVLQGGYQDEYGVWRAGMYARYEDGTTHHPVALPGGPPCIFFGFTEEGIVLLDAAPPPAP
ncbi:MAG: cupin domain-containing protein [Planctomycetes bacterium]|nr:cupin domain-containing protein [Planctomycetota bacterium]